MAGSITGLDDSVLKAIAVIIKSEIVPELTKDNPVTNALGSFKSSCESTSIP